MAEVEPRASTSSVKTAARKSDASLLSIGQLVAELRSEFPELSISKVRYLEDRGLVAPQRTKGKYRKYSRADARRLRAILAMQRDEYLPLDVIRRRLDGRKDMGGKSGVEGAGEFAGRATALLAHDEPKYTLEDVLEMLEVEEEFVRSLVEFRLVDQAADTGPAFTEGDVETARVCQRLRHFNVEPRHLRMLSSAAEREAGLIEQIVIPDLRSGHTDRKEYGMETAQELAALFADLTQLILHRELQRML